MSERLERFTKLLKEIFELDKSDLDFGIYRIMNLRKTQIETFLTNRLPQMVQETLAPFAQDSKEEIRAKMDQIKESVAEMGLTVENLPENALKKQEYIKLQKQLMEGADLAGLETDVYSALYTFFNRYYDEGDFISKRRYKEGVYAIPYEGEEVKLYWANQDQYYIKTSENFKDFSFVFDGITVHFRLVDATTEQNNNKESKDNKRTFMLFTEDEEKYPGIKTFEYDADAAEIVIRFVYDIPQDKKKKYSEENYAAITAWLLSLRKAELNTLIAPIPTGKGKETTTLLEKRLKDYVAKNTFDYFIHKDLHGFLTRELDFFIKSEVMHLEDLDTESEARIETYLAKVRAIKRVGRIIIDFLSQFENFQKKLWLKKKFVVETNWCITLDKIDESFWSEIIANNAQIDEWIAMYAIDEAEGWTNPPTVDFLRANQNLIIDTKHFSDTFKFTLLESIPNLDEQTDGILINGDNFHALRLLNTSFENAISCIYIDPPYNTGPSDILYKNNYKDSSWLSLMYGRIEQASFLMDDSCTICVAIDDYEMVKMAEMLDETISGYERNMVVINHHPQGTPKDNISRTHEYAVILTPEGDAVMENSANIDGFETRAFMRSGSADNNYRYGRPNSFYAVLVDMQNKMIMGIEAPPKLNESYPREDTTEGWKRIYPLGKDGTERVWRISYNSKSLHNRDLNELILCRASGTLYQKVYRKKEPINSNWVDKRYNAGTYGTEIIKDMLGASNVFSYPKSIYTVQDYIKSVTDPENVVYVLDFFAGSGTTGQAVIDLNHIDDGKRKYILVEMGNYFVTATLPRVKKSVYATDVRNWKNAKPNARNNGVSQIIKYMRLESYEDALSNIKLSDNGGRFQELLGENYMIRYMVDFESRGNLLDVKAFSDPFAYNMKITEKNECKTRPVDLVETFNYLIGLNVASQSAISYWISKPAEHPIYEGAVDLVSDDNGPYAFRQIEGVLPDGRRALVIWRTVTENVIASNAALDAYFTTYRKNADDRKYDVIFVNGDNNLEILCSNNESWNVQMIEIEFKNRMFEET